MAKNAYGSILILLLITYAGYAQPGNRVRENVVKAYTSQIGVREKTGHNDGAAVEGYLKYTGLGKGYAWCAAFVCWCYGQADIPNPKTAYAPNLFKGNVIIYVRGKKPMQQPLSGDVFGIYFNNMGRIAHVGFINQWGDKEVVTVEGNTNGAGSRDGDGVYKKKRLTRQIYSVARYIR